MSRPRTRTTQTTRTNREYVTPLNHFYLVLAVLLGYALHAFAEPTHPAGHAVPPFFASGTVYPKATLAHAHIVVQHSDLARYGENLVEFWNDHRDTNGYTTETVRLVDRAQIRASEALTELRRGAAALEPQKREQPISNALKLSPRPRRFAAAPGINVNLDVGSGISAFFQGMFSLFGIGETADIKANQKHLIARTDILVDEFEEQRTFLLKLRTTLAYNIQAIANETNHLRADQRRFEYAALLADSFDTITLFATRLTRGMQALATGRLTTDFISLTEADLVIDKLRTTTSSHGLSLGISDPLNFFLLKFSVSITPELIDVLVSCPAFDSSEPFRLYEFSPIPIIPASPMAMPSGLASGLFKVPPIEDTKLTDPLWLVESATWLAISDGLPNERQTAVWTTSEFKHSCKQFSPTEHYCLETFIIKEAASSCLPALFLGLPTFSSTCDFHRVVTAQPLYRFSTSGHLLTYNWDDTPLEVSCDRNTKHYFTLSGLNSYLPPAGCTLATPTWSLPALPSMPTSSTIFTPWEYKHLNFGKVDGMSLENVTVFEDHTLHLEVLPDPPTPRTIPPIPTIRRAAPWAAIGISTSALAIVTAFVGYLVYVLKRMTPPAPAAPAAPLADIMEELHQLHDNRAPADSARDPPQGEAE